MGGMAEHMKREEWHRLRAELSGVASTASTVAVCRAPVNARSRVG